MRLLVSLRRADEVAAAVRGGADILDIKNPAEGALGAPVPEDILHIRALAPPGLPVSVALGDAPMLPGTMALAAFGAASCGVEYVKVGLCGPRDAAQAVALLEAVCHSARQAGSSARVIAAGYADAREFGAVEPRDLPRAAKAAGAHGCMLDTMAKDGRSLFDVLDWAGLEAFLGQCRGLGLECALAGSLRYGHMPRVRALGPDIVGLRSALCGGDRADGRVDAAAVARFKAAV